MSSNGMGGRDICMENNKLSSRVSTLALPVLLAPAASAGGSSGLVYGMSSSA